MAKRSGGSPDHGGVAWRGAARVVVKLPEMDISDFEKIKSKNFKKGMDLRLRMTFGG